MNLKKQKHGLTYHNIQYVMEQKEEILLCIFDGLYNMESIFVNFLFIFFHIYIFFLSSIELTDQPR